MKVETTDRKKQYAEPQVRVCMIESTSIIATSNEPDEIYPILRD